MNKNILIVLIGGFLVAVLVALLVQVSLGSSKKKERSAKQQQAQVMIVVATKPLKAGDRITLENAKWQSWPQNGVFPGAIVRKDANQSLEKAVSGRLLRAVAEGEPIMMSGIIDDKDGGKGMMAASLRKGMRAVSIELRPAAIVSGFVNPGDYVDVILTYRARVTYDGDDLNITNMSEANLDRLATETIIENVRVLAVDQKMSTDQTSGGKGKPKIAKTVTLEVTPKGAEVVGLARKMGDVTLALRRLGDDTVSTEYTAVTTDSRITNIWDEIYATMESMRSDYAGQSENSMRIYNGASVMDIQSHQ